MPTKIITIEAPTCRVANAIIQELTLFFENKMTPQYLMLNPHLLEFGSEIGWEYKGNYNEQNTTK